MSDDNRAHSNKSTGTPNKLFEVEARKKPAPPPAVAKDERPPSSLTSQSTLLGGPPRVSLAARKPARARLPRMRPQSGRGAQLLRISSEKKLGPPPPRAAQGEGPRRTLEWREGGAPDDRRRISISHTQVSGRDLPPALIRCGASVSFSLPAVAWSIGRCARAGAIYADCGLGKTPMAACLGPRTSSAKRTSPS